MENKALLNIGDAERIAELAKLDFSALDVERICSDLNEMIFFASRLSELEKLEKKDFEGSFSLSSLREDKPSLGISREELLRSAESSCDGFISVPRVIGGESR